MTTRTADFANLGNRYLIETAATDGRFALIEHTIAPRKLAAPMHVHEREDEYWFVLGGRMGADRRRGRGGRPRLTMDMESIGRLIQEHGLTG